VPETAQRPAWWSHTHREPRDPELTAPPVGDGEGKMSLFARIIADKKAGAIALDDYGTQLVLLEGVRREAAGW
jgi:hypothetical protein